MVACPHVGSLYVVGWGQDTSTSALTFLLSLKIILGPAFEEYLKLFNVSPAGEPVNQVI